MSRLLLINASQPEEIRIALVEAADHKQHRVLDLDIESTYGQRQRKGNVYAGRISSIEPALEAVFIDYGAQRHGFLPFKEIATSFAKDGDRKTLKTNLQVGQKLMVQIKKEERGTKGAALTTYITLPGSYLVLMPNNPSAGGISRRIEGEKRREISEIFRQLVVPNGMGIILRTAGVRCDFTNLQTDLTSLLQKWEAITQAFEARTAPFLIFQEGDVVARAIRDHLRVDIDEILVDEAAMFEKAKSYTAQIRPDLLPKLRHYQDNQSLFLRSGIEDAVESVFQHELRLPSGGTIVFNQFEALVAIDINSGGSTRHEDIETTALQTNLEAAELIAQHLRLRDLGGLIVIDFIDMELEANKQKVEERLRAATQPDRARIQMGRISNFGLLEMSRQRLRPSLGKATETLCPCCQGQGRIRSIESLALSILRTLEKHALYKNVHQIRVEASLALVTYLANEKRSTLLQLEKNYSLTVILLPVHWWTTSRYRVTPFQGNEGSTLSQIASYGLLANSSEQGPAAETSSPTLPEIPAVQDWMLAKAGSASPAKSKLWQRLLARLKSWMKGIRAAPHSQPRPLTLTKRHPRRLRHHKREGSHLEGRLDNKSTTEKSKERGSLSRHRSHPKTTQAGFPKTSTRNASQNAEASNVGLQKVGNRSTRLASGIPPVSIKLPEPPTLAPAALPEVVSPSVAVPLPAAAVAARVERRPPRRYGDKPKLRRRSYMIETAMPTQSVGEPASSARSIPEATASESLPANPVPKEKEEGNLT